ncbi:AcrR family transcriptional regulator [Leucobacter exalbidus]|uniref:AcrR family transcriptional regulator n=1 Tax=Leucobacter exalbidus TaxID=662960 RepID=A0A940PRD8_9MICO|nr:TetR/AcrR family transcriptional regulator [Leucobacter exalbidus]MBP1326164.1 AcrR family transcriptional regulator [Leucobacter exalbidus]
MGYAKHDERREQILSAAAGLLAEAGMEQLSVRAVAQAAGIGMGTLRHYFSNQKLLHEALILKLVDEETQDFEIHDQTLPAPDRLERCLLQFVPTLDEATHLLDVWFGMYRVGLDPSGSPFAREFLELSTTRSRERIREWLSIVSTEGHLESSAVRTHALELSALISGVCLELVTPGAEMTVDDARSIVSRAARAIPKAVRA